MIEIMEEWKGGIMEYWVNSGLKKQSKSGYLNPSLR
jgi:hypothetical protein